MMTTLERLTGDIKSAYDNAVQAWTGWDWPHSFGGTRDDCEYCDGLSCCGSQIVIEPDDDDIDDPPQDACEHYRSALGAAREYRDGCAVAARHAESLAGDAMDHIRAGDWEAAMACIDDACSAESAYGDCPTWKPVRTAIEAAIAELEAAEIIDGMYFLHPEGSCWIGAEYRNGLYIGRIEQSNAATHAAARDHYAGTVPSETDEEVSLPVAEAIVRDVMGEDTDPHMVVVTKSHE